MTAPARPEPPASTLSVGRVATVEFRQVRRTNGGTEINTYTTVKANSAVRRARHRLPGRAADPGSRLMFHFLLGLAGVELRDTARRAATTAILFALGALLLMVAVVGVLAAIFFALAERYDPIIAALLVAAMAFVVATLFLIVGLFAAEAPDAAPCFAARRPCSARGAPGGDGTRRGAATPTKGAGERQDPGRRCCRCRTARPYSWPTHLTSS